MAKKQEEFLIKKSETVELNFYAVRSQDGKWLRSRGYGGYGQHWVDNLSDAKVWGKPGPAKAQVTYWANHFPTYGVPELVQITTGTCNYLDQTDRVSKAAEKKKIATAKRVVDNLEYKINNYIERNQRDNRQISQWRDDLEKARKELDRLKL